MYFHTSASTDVEAVITNAELAENTGADVSDPLLPGLAIAATAAAIEFLQFELITRERVTTYETWPTAGTNTAPDLSGNNLYLKHLVEVPYAKLTDPVMLTVEVVGEVTTDYRIIDRLWASVYFNAPTVSGDLNTAPAIKMTYNAGYGTIDDVPQVIKTAVTMIATYLFDHRGGCSATDAINQSGANTLLTPYRAKAIII